ncbi:UNVERIFIED_CONTAM: Ubiquitin domain-containing protein DSK2 [Sesamum indicum]
MGEGESSERKSEQASILNGLGRSWFELLEGQVELVANHPKYGQSPEFFTVALNDSLHGFFPGRKGLRQGDPMSSALFLLSMKHFSRLVKKKTSISDFNFHPKCEKLKSTHLLFADDLMLFSQFKDASDLTVNTSKLSIFTAGIQNEELDGILAHTEFARGEMPVRYLDIPLAAQRLLVTNYSPLVDQIANCISKWTGKSLSYAGRLELIRLVIQGVENFLWNSRKAPVAWEEICHPKEEGGLGIRHIQSWNVALLARVLWNIHRKADTLCVQWVNGVYLRGASIWDWQPKKGDSPLLQRLAEIRNRVVTDFGSPEAAIEQMTRWSTPKGLQTSKAYEYFKPKLARQHWKAAIWKVFTPPKYSFILSLGLRGRLNTRDRLGFLKEEDLCSLCINTKESAKHIFFECPFSNFLGINRSMSTLQSAVKWLKKEKTGSSMQNKARHLALACTVYTLWRHHNEVIFEGLTPCPEGLIILVKTLLEQIPIFHVVMTFKPSQFTFLFFAQNCFFDSKIPRFELLIARNFSLIFFPHPILVVFLYTPLMLLSSECICGALGYQLFACCAVLQIQPQIKPKGLTLALFSDVAEYMAESQLHDGSSTSDVSGGCSDSNLQLNIKTLDSRIYSFNVDKNVLYESLLKEKRKYIKESIGDVYRRPSRILRDPFLDARDSCLILAQFLHLNNLNLLLDDYYITCISYADCTMVVSAFKEKIASQSGVPVGQQRLIFRGKVLKDDHLLSEYNVENGDTLHLVERQPQPSPGSSSREATSSSGGRGQDPNAGVSRNRIGPIAHSIVLGTLNVGDPGEAVVPDLSRAESFVNAGPAVYISPSGPNPIMVQEFMEMLDHDILQRLHDEMGS